LTSEPRPAPTTAARTTTPPPRAFNALRFYLARELTRRLFATFAPPSAECTPASTTSSAIKCKPTASCTLPDPTLAAWAIVGLGTVADLGRELGLLAGPARQKLMAHVGRLPLEGATE
jgi:hypothetical protein